MSHSTYDSFSSTFAASRKNMRWPEIEYFIEDLKKRRSSDKRGSALVEGGLQKEITPPCPPCQRGVFRVLDVGCGSGRLLGELKKTGIECDYLGVDASVGMIDEAKKEHPDADFRVLDMRALDTLDTKFDAVFFLASFHHLESAEDRLSVLKMLSNIVKMDGVVYMTNWNLLSPENMARYSAGYRGEGDFDIKIGAHYRYYHGFSAQELGELFVRSDFQVIENRVFEWERNIISLLTK